MNSVKWQNIKDLTSQALALPVGEQSDFLARETDEEIRFEAKKLLAAIESSEDFIAQPFLVEHGIVEDLEADIFIGEKIGNYQLQQRIGTGGMGAVYLAERLNADFKQKVAVKIIKRGMDTEAVLKRFLIERQILAQLEHPFIARLLDGDTTENGLPYFVMEYIEGEEIRDYCEKHSFDVKKRLEIFQKVCQAVSYAHQKLIVHRDIKPSNLIVTSDGVPKLLDFGIAKLLSLDWNSSEAEATQTVFRLMTPEYASPEQLRGKITTVSTDVYSLGVVLYELLTGVRPFDLKNKDPFTAAEEVLTKEALAPSSAISRNHSVNTHKTDEGKDENLPKRLYFSTLQNTQTAARNLKGDLDNIVLKAIRKEPENRYASVQEFSEDIRRYLNGLPVLATAGSTRYRFTKFIGRHQKSLTIAGLVMVVFFALSVFSIYQGIAAMKERDKANQRYEKLRDVAKLLMTDTQESLAKVPGTIQVRKNLAEKSVDLLDSIYDESTTDTQFLSELAESYDKLGRYQLWDFHDFENSRKSIEKAVAIRRRVIVLEPQNLPRKNELTASLANLSEYYSFKNDHEGYIAVESEIESIYRSIAEKEPTPKNLSALALHLLGVAARYKDLQMPERYTDAQKKGIEILEPVIQSYEGKTLTPPEKNDLAWLMMWQADFYKESGNDAQALQIFERAAQLAETAYREDDSIRLAFNHTSSIHRELGQIYEKQGNYQKALEMYKFSFDWLSSKTGDEKFGKILVQGIFSYAVRCALMLNKLGKKQEADEFITKPLRDFQAISAEEDSAAFLTYKSEPLNDLSRYFVATNRLENAVEIWQQQFDLLQKFTDKNPDDPTFLNYQVEAQTRMGDIYSAYDKEVDSFETSDAQRLKKAKLHFEKASEIYHRSQTFYQPTQLEIEDLQKLDNKIARLR